MLAFQAADIYQVQAFRGYEKQYLRLASAWSVVFLIVIGASFFAKIGDQFSRVWLGSFYVAGLVVAARLAPLAVPRWCGAGRAKAASTRRTVIVGGGDAARDAHRWLDRANADTDIRIFGVFDDRGDDRSPPIVAGVPEARHRRRSGRVRPPHARRSGDLLAADHGREPHAADAARSSGCCRSTSACRRTPTSCASARAPIPTSATSRCSTSSTSRSPTGTSCSKWLFDKIVGALSCSSLSPRHGADRARHQARQPRPGALQAEALRLQQRADRGLQVPLDVHRSWPTPTPRSSSPRTIRASPASAASSARPASTSCRSSSTSSSRATCRWSARARTRSRPRPPTASTTKSVDGYFARHRVKPGITGWAQINGWRGETDTAEKIQQRVEHDLYYIENWSVLFDLYILALTPFALSRPRTRIEHGGCCVRGSDGRAGLALRPQAGRLGARPRRLPRRLRHQRTGPLRARCSCPSSSPGSSSV